jgi:hypothetical protein
VARAVRIAAIEQPVCRFAPPVVAQDNDRTGLREVVVMV